jgi:hypothetical protein
MNFDWKNINWTLVGRILLFLNMALCLAFAFWAYEAYSQRLDLSAQFKARQTEVENLKKARATAESRWDMAQAQVLAGEQMRPQLLAGYAAVLKKLREGPGPAQDLQYDPKTGALQIGANGVPVLGPVKNAAGQPIPGLENLAAASQTYDQRQAALRQVAEENQKLVDQEKSLTSKIGDGSHGLRADLAAVQREEKKSLDEQEFLRPLLYNREVEAQILAKRQQALKERVKELGATPVAQAR